MAADSTAVTAAPAPAAVRHVYVAPPEPRSNDAPRPGAERHTVSTAMFDSIGADTVSGRLPRFATDEYADSVAASALADTLAARVTIAEYPSGRSNGIAPEALRTFPAGGSALGALMMATIAVVAINGKGMAHAVRTYRNALVSVRRRNNAFDGSGRVSIPSAILLALVFVVFGGVALYLGAGVPLWPGFSGAATAMGLMAAYYVFQLVAYSTVGYAFATNDGRRQWVDGFAASQAFAGLLLIVPALLLLCMPQWHLPLSLLAALVYVAARIVFICKGFRIFYHKLSSLLYFILYLCTLEIIPALVVLRALTTVIAYAPHGAC